MTNTIRCAAGLLSMLFMTSAQAFEDASFRGIKDVAVEVSISPELARVGMTDQRVKTWIEVGLRKLGIRVVDDGFQTTNSSPLLSIDVSTLDYDGVGFTYSTDVSLWQYVRSFNDDEAIWASTWSQGHFGYYDRPLIARILRDTLAEGVTEFSNEVHKANPK